MNTVRLMINADSVDNNGQTRFIVPGGNCVDASGVPVSPAPTLSDPLAPYPQALKRLDVTLAEMRKVDLKAVIVVGYVYCRGAKGYWEDAGKPLRDHIVQLWSALAGKYASDPTVVAYDLLNEPDQDFALNGAGAANLQGQYDAYNKDLLPRLVSAVRAQDPSTYLVVEPAPMALPVGYAGVGGFGQNDGPIKAQLQPVADPSNRVIYSFHDYTPATYTVQTMGSANVSYPGMARNFDQPQDVYWDKNTLRAYFQPVRDFQLRNNARIYVGEVGAERFAPGAAQYYADNIALFEEYGWDWTLQSMANSSEWNATFTPTDTQVGAAYGNVYTDRLKVLLDGWGLNPRTAYYGKVRLPYPVDGPYFTDFTGATTV